jgi:uncharacterized membrane protein YcaP (DUF421 family)
MEVSMLKILLRTLLIYGFLILIMRFMGKRQLGELEITDLVTTLLISEIASLPLTEEDIPLHHALLPILIIAGLEVGMSALLLKRPIFKRLLIPRPTILMSHGVPDRKAMKKARLSCEELLSQLRLKGVNDPQNVEYAVMESNGQISVIQSESDGDSTTLTGVMRLIISDGWVNRDNLRLIGRDTDWLEKYLKKRGLHARDVFMLLSDGGKVLRLYPMHPEKQKKDSP